MQKIPPDLPERSTVVLVPMFGIALCLWVLFGVLAIY